MDPVNKILLIIGAFPAAYLIFHYLVWIPKRTAAILKFEDKCRQLILERPSFPYPTIYGITEEKYYEEELAKYEKKKPSKKEMLNSTTKLTIENWFSINDQKYLFGIISTQESPKWTINTKTSV